MCRVPDMEMSPELQHQIWESDRGRSQAVIVLPFPSQCDLLFPLYAPQMNSVKLYSWHFSYSNKTQPAVLSSDLIRIPDKRRLVLSRVTCDCVTFTRTLQHMDMWTFVLIGLFFLFLFLNQLYFFFIFSSYWQNWNATQKDDKKPSVCRRMKILTEDWSPN